MTTDDRGWMSVCPRSPSHRRNHVSAKIKHGRWQNRCRQPEAERKVTQKQDSVSAPNSQTTTAMTTTRGPKFVSTHGRYSFTLNIETNAWAVGWCHSCRCWKTVQDKKKRREKTTVRQRYRKRRQTARNTPRQTQVSRKEDDRPAPQTPTHAD